MANGNYEAPTQQPAPASKGKTGNEAPTRELELTASANEETPMTTPTKGRPSLQSFSNPTTDNYFQTIIPRRGDDDCMLEEGAPNQDNH